jgi:hypothetical protein
MKAVIRLFKVYEKNETRCRLFIRNHWTRQFNDSFLFILDRQSQGYQVNVYRLGIFNVCICLLISKN